MAADYAVAGKSRTISLAPADTNEATIFTAAKGNSVISLRICNVDGTNAADATVRYNDGSTDFALISTKSIAADDYLYEPDFFLPMQSGWTLKVTSSAANDLVFTIVVLEGQSAVGHSLHQAHV